MTEEFRDELVAAVKAAAKVLSDEEALAIVKICRFATERAEAELTEEYLIKEIEGGDSE